MILAKTIQPLRTRAWVLRYEDKWVAGLTWDFMGPELPVEGCMDTDATNYNPNALFSDNSCEYQLIEGCLDSDAKNYNPEAEIDDGS